MCYNLTDWRTAVTNRYFWGLITLAVLGCSSQPTEIEVGQVDDPGSAAHGKAYVTRSFEQSYSVCARNYPRGRLLDLSLDGRHIPPDEVINRVELARSGASWWNGAPIDRAQLRQFLDITTGMTPQPLLVVHVEKDAPQKAIEDLHEAIVRASICPQIPR